MSASWVTGGLSSAGVESYARLLVALRKLEDIGAKEAGLVRTIGDDSRTDLVDRNNYVPKASPYDPQSTGAAPSTTASDRRRCRVEPIR